MTPKTFLDEVAHPNMVAALKRAGDTRAIVNAILSLDAIAGIIHAHGVAAHAPDMAAYAGDEAYREALSHVSRSYRVLRDASASFKHGNLTYPRKDKLARLLTGPEAMRIVPNGAGLMQCGVDRLGGSVVIIEHGERPGYVRASDVIADSYRMLSRIVAGERAQTDEHDRGSFAVDGDEPRP